MFHATHNSNDLEGEELVPDTSFLVKDHKVDSSSILILKFPIVVQVHMPNESTVVEIATKDDQVSTTIKEETGIPTPRLHLFYKDRELEDYNRSISSSSKGVFQHVTYKLKLKVNDWVVHLYTLKGQRYAMGVDAGESIYKEFASADPPLGPREKQKGQTLRQRT